MVDWSEGPWHDDVPQFIRDAEADPTAFERTLKEALEKQFARPGLTKPGYFQARGHDGLRVQEVSFEGEYPDTQVVYYLHDDRAPDARLGWRAGRIWNSFVLEWGPEVGSIASMMGLWLQEDIDAQFYGLPANYFPEAVTWIQPHTVTLDEAITYAPFELLFPERLPAGSLKHVVFEDRREFWLHANVRLDYELSDRSYCVAMSDRFRWKLPEGDWDSIQPGEWMVARDPSKHIVRAAVFETGPGLWAATILSGLQVIVGASIAEEDVLLDVARSLGPNG